MINWALSFVAPHHCCGCGIIGTLLCDNCKYNIIDEPFLGCLACSSPTPSDSNVCTACSSLYSHAWCVGERSDALKQLIDCFKFSRAKSAYMPLARLLNDILPELPKETVLVPIPTVSAHIRERGYDHMQLIVRQLAKQRTLPCQPYLIRTSTVTQRGASRSQRAEQAKDAFRCFTQLDPNTPYLIIDDVVTTGATLEYAAKTLRQAGARRIWVASVSKQPI